MKLLTTMLKTPLEDPRTYISSKSMILETTFDRMVQKRCRLMGRNHYQYLDTTLYIL